MVFYQFLQQILMFCSQVCHRNTGCFLQTIIQDSKSLRLPELLELHVDFHTTLQKYPCAVQLQTKKFKTKRKHILKKRTADKQHTTPSTKKKHRSRFSSQRQYRYCCFYFMQTVSETGLFVESRFRIHCQLFHSQFHLCPISCLFSGFLSNLSHPEGTSDWVPTVHCLVQLSRVWRVQTSEY